MKKILTLGLVALMACETPIPVSSEDAPQLGTRRSVPNEFVFIGDKAVVTRYFEGDKVEHTVRKIDQDADVYRVSHQSERSFEAIKADLKNKLELIEPNYVLQLKGSKDAALWPRDPLFTSLWGMNSVGQNAPLGTEAKPNVDMDLVKAWQITKGASHVLVAVVDTGADYNHPDLKDNIFVNAKEARGQAGVDDDNNGYVDDVHGMDFAPGEASVKPFDTDPMDEHGHGTHTAGTIAAVGDNGLGVVGVAPGVRVMPVRGLDGYGMGTSAGLYEALRYATKTKADVISNSWGGAASLLIERAVRQAAEAGAIVVFAAGNDYAKMDERTSMVFGKAWDLPNVIVVGAYGYDGNKADFTNFGQPVVHVFAPGVNVMSTIPRALAIGEPYAAYSGTSMATPAVAGLAALLLSHDASLKTPGAMKQRLIETSVTDENLYGLSVSNGRVNAFNALSGQTAPALPPRTVEPYHFATPEYPDVETDVRHQVKIDGAKAIQVHFADGFQEFADIVAVYDGAYRLVETFTGEAMVDTWSTLVAGDTVYVRFANAYVVYDELLVTGTPYWSNRSRGFVIDQVAYIR